MRKNINMDEVLEDLEAGRRAGKLANEVSSSCIRYSVDPEDPERLVAIDRGGRKWQLPQKPDAE